LDKELATSGLHFVRYADDSIFHFKSEKASTTVMSSITSFIVKKLRWIMNTEKSKIFQSFLALDFTMILL